MNVVALADKMKWVVNLFRRPRMSMEVNARDMLFEHLGSLEIAVSKAKRGRPQEQMGARDYASRGLIDVSGGPISWINVVTTSKESGLGRVVYGIPASGLSRVGDFLLWSIRVKRIPRFGWVVGVHWESYMKLPPALRHLNEDATLKQLMREHLNEDVELRSQPGQGLWLLTVGKGGLIHLPSAGEWSCYQAIALAVSKLDRSAASPH